MRGQRGVRQLPFVGKMGNVPFGPGLVCPAGESALVGIAGIAAPVPVGAAPELVKLGQTGRSPIPARRKTAVRSVCRGCTYLWSPGITTPLTPTHLNRLARLR